MTTLRQVRPWIEMVVGDAAQASWISRLGGLCKTPGRSEGVYMQPRSRHFAIAGGMSFIAMWTSSGVREQAETPRTIRRDAGLTNHLRAAHHEAPLYHSNVQKP